MSRIPVVLLFFACGFLTTSQAADRPNIVLLLADDLGWTGLGCFGSDLYETPNLDALARRGVRFTNAHSACTVCSPTRASIMTGKSPAQLNLTDFIAGQNRPFAKLTIPDWTKRLESDEITIAETLQQAGYRTGHIGKWHLRGVNVDARGTTPLDQGFDESFERPKGSKGYLLKMPSEGESQSTYLTDALTDKACEFIDRAKAEPFFLYFAYNVSHTPIQGREDLVTHFHRKVRAGAVHNNPTYAAMVASLDESAGRVISKLKEHGLSDNTLVVFISDNGGLTQRHGKHDGFTENLPLRRGKGSAYSGGVRVPAIVSWPGIMSAGSVCDAPVITTDLYATFADAAGIDVPSPSADGRSWKPLIHAPHTKIDRNLYWHYPHYHAGGDSPYSAILSGDYRLIDFHEDNSIRLYNVSRDIGEQTDLSSSMPDMAARLLSLLNQWRDSVDAQMPTPNPSYDSARAAEVVRQRKR